MTRFLVSAVALAAIVVSGCGPSAESAANRAAVIGSWRAQEGPFVNVWTFSEDGTFVTQVLGGRQGFDMALKGTFEFTGRRLKFTHSNGNKEFTEYEINLTGADEFEAKDLTLPRRMLLKFSRHPGKP